jgi:excinuclease ABC subunit C
MINEAVRRYFERVAKGEFDMPQLVVIDGGRGQLGAACKAIRETAVDLPPILALAKKDEELYFPHQPAPYSLSRRSQALRFLQRLRDEAHRFAVTYHRKVRKRETLRTRLEDIPGVGRARVRTLLEAFGSPAAVAQANEQQLASLQGISPALAGRIVQRMKGKKTDAEST